MNESFTNDTGSLNNHNLDSNTVSQLSFSSTTSSSSTESQSGLISSLRKIVNDNLMQYMVNLKLTDVSLNGWRYKLLFGWLNFYYMLVGWIINFSSSYYTNDYTTTSSSWISAPFGFYGGWVARVLNFPLTLSIDVLGSPYELFIALTALFLVLLMILPIFLVLRTRSFYAEKKQKLDLYTVLYSVFMLLLAPFMMFVMSSFVDCNTKDNTLMRFPSTSCYQSTNLVLIVISLIGMIVLCCFSFIYTYILPINDLKNSIPFVCEDSFQTMITFSAILFRILFMFIIPPQYMYIRSIVHLISSLSVAIFQIYLLSFFRRFENSIHVAGSSCSFGASIGVLITTLVNSEMQDTLGVGLFFGLVIGLSILFGLSGFIICELYTRIIMRRIRSILTSPSIAGMNKEHTRQEAYSIEKESAEIYLSMEHYSLRSLRLFMRFCSSSKDVDMMVSFIKGISTKKQYNDTRLIISSAIMIVSRWNDTNKYNFGVYLLKKAMRVGGNYWQNLNLHYRIKQFEIDQSNTSLQGRHNLEIKNATLILEKKQDELKSVHKAFWKELTIERPNSSKLSSLISLATTLTKYCDENFRNLMSNFPHDKTVVRHYAKYIETIKMDRIYSSQLFDEASALEEEESKHFKQLNSKRNLRASLRIYPVDRKAFREEEDEVLKQENFEGVETLSENKKEETLRNALNSPYQSKVRSVIYVCIMCLCMIAVFICFAVTNYYQTQLSNSPLIKDSCYIQSTYGGLFRNLRMAQIVWEYFEDMKSPLPLVNSTEFYNIQSFNTSFFPRIEEKREALRELERNSQIGLFTSGMFSDFTIEDKLINIPLPNDTGKRKEYTNIYKRYASTREVNSVLLEHIDKAILSRVMQFYEVVVSYEFMYIYQNRRTGADAFLAFCKSMQSTQKKVIDETRALLLNIVIGIGISIICLFLLFLVLSRIEMETFSIIVSLFKKIPKDIVGVIYLDLEKQSKNDEIKKIEQVVTSAKNRTLLVGVLICLLIIVSVVLFYYEFSDNIKKSEQAMFNIDIASFMVRVSNRMTQRLNEIFSYKVLPLGRPVNHPSVVTSALADQYRLENRDHVQILHSSYNQIVYGSNHTEKLMGVFAEIDEMLVGSNCNSTDIFSECVSLIDLITFFCVKSAEATENMFNPIYTSKTTERFYEILYLYNLNDYVTIRINEFLNLIVKYTENPNRTLSIIVLCVSSLSMIVLGWYFYNCIVGFDNEMTMLRSFLSYVPLEWIESNEEYKNFVYYKSIPIWSLKKSKSSSKGSDGVSNILQSMIDGAFIANEKSEILLFNNAAQKMFAKNSSEVMGLQFQQLFEYSRENDLKHFIDNRNKYLESQGGEMFEVECIRKNQTRFPASLNLFVTRNEEKKPIIVGFFKDITMEKKQNILLNEEKKNSDILLRNILPDAVAIKLKSGETEIAEKFPDITCFFSDMVGFTQMSAGMNPSELIKMLGSIVNAFDDLTEIYNLEKIKTIGDAYFCVGGLHNNSQSDHPERSIRFSIDALAVIHKYNEENNKRVNIRIGLNTGSVIAGVLGKKKFAYDLWGDTINFASRMESTSLPGRIHISRSTYERVYDLGMEFEERMVDVKGKGKCKTYLLKEKHHINPVDVGFIESAKFEEDTNNEITENTSQSGDEVVRRE